MVHPRGDIPIDGPNFVAGLVFANFVKVHPLALKGRVVLPGQTFGDQSTRANLDLPDLAEQFWGNSGLGFSGGH